MKPVSCCLLGLLLLTTCGRSRPPGSVLTIATAANMQFAMETLIEAFTLETGIACQTVISSSGKLTAQIREGAPFDVFVSADMKYPQELFAGGFTTEAPRVYAYGKLVLWTMVEGLEPTMASLTTETVRHIALANPRMAPYGQAAMEVMGHYQLQGCLQAKLIYGESIAQTNQFIISKAAEIGFTAKSVIRSPQMQGRGQWQELDPALYSPIAQGVVLIRKHTSPPESARRFCNFLFSATGRTILEQFGYQTPSI